MSDGINLVMLLGNIGADPELKTTEKGAALKFRLATSETWFDTKEQKKQERTEWHNVVVFGKRAEGLSRVLKKGSRIAIRGPIRSHSYEKDNQKRWFTEVVADDVTFAGGPPNGAYKPAPASSQQDVAAPF